MINGKYLGKDGRYYENYDNKLLADQREDLCNKFRKEQLLNKLEQKNIYSNSIFYYKENELKTVADWIKAMFVWAIIIPIVVFIIGMVFIATNLFKNQAMFFGLCLKIWIVIGIIYAIAVIGNNKK